MALEVRTANGNQFRRCGIAFGKDPTVVDDKQLKTKLGPPNHPKGATVESVLTEDPMLICRPVKGGEPSENGKK